MSEAEEQPKPQIPYRQIRAHYDAEHITVYQAYSGSIATVAVQHQKLNASPKFSPSRMTWIKPSWCWMMYRSGYSLKDSNQSHILALQMTHENFQHLLSQAVVPSRGHALSGEEKKMPVRVQWDPERTPRLDALPYRSIQIGISGELRKRWVEEWIESIEDVTEKALALKRAVEDNQGVEMEELMERGFMPAEREYIIPKELCQTLGMDPERREKVLVSK